MTKPIFLKRDLFIPHVFAILILSLVLIALDQGSQAFHHFFNRSAVIVKPLQLAVQKPAWWLHSASNSIHNASKLEQENQSLKALLLKAHAKIQDLENAAQQDKMIRGLATSQVALKTNSQVALVSKLSTSKQQYIINKGLKDGIKNGMAVLNEHGVLGQVVRASDHSATVRMLTAKDIAVPVKDARSEVMSIAEGKSGSLVLSKVAELSDVKVGDVFETTGLGGVYPANIPVATVASVDKDHNGFLKVSLKPVANLDYQEAVLVVGDAS